MASDFWQTVRKAAGAASAVFAGKPITAPAKDASPVERALAVGATLGYPVSNKWEELAHGTSWNYVGVHTVAKMWALASWTAYDKSQPAPVTKAHAQDAPAEQRTPVQDHPALKLLHRPNPVMGRMRFMYTIGTHLRLSGGWVIWEVRGTEDGKPVELWPLPRAWLTYFPATEQFPLGYFRVFNPRGPVMYWGASKLSGGFYIDYRDCIIDHWPHPLYPGEPASPLTQCSRIIDIMEQTDVAVWSSLMEAPKPGMILSVDGTVQMTDIQLKQMSDTIQANKGGATNAGKVMVLQGVTVEKLGTPLSELDAVAVREQNMKFGLGVQGVPSVATGIRNEIGSYSGDAATFNAFAEWGIQPDLDLFASSLNHRWLRYYGEDFELEASAKRMDDPILDQKKADQIYVAVKDGFCPPNQWLAVMKLPPIPGGDAVQPPPMPAGPVTQNFHNGQPVPGDGGAGPDAGADDFDLDLDLPDDEGPGDKRPERQAAAGNRLPAFSANGKGH